MPVTFAVKEDEMYGLSQGQKQSGRPKIKGQTLVTADEAVGFGPQELQGQGHKER